MISINVRLLYKKKIECNTFLDIDIKLKPVFISIFFWYTLYLINRNAKYYYIFIPN